MAATAAQMLPAQMLRPRCCFCRPDVAVQMLLPRCCCCCQDVAANKLLLLPTYCCPNAATLEDNSCCIMHKPWNCAPATPHSQHTRCLCWLAGTCTVIFDSAVFSMLEHYVPANNMPVPAKELPAGNCRFLCLHELTGNGAVAPPACKLRRSRLEEATHKAGAN